MSVEECPKRPMGNECGSSGNHQDQTAIIKPLSNSHFILKQLMVDENNRNTKPHYMHLSILDFVFILASTKAFNLCSVLVHKLFHIPSLSCTCTHTHTKHIHGIPLECFPHRSLEQFKLIILSLCNGNGTLVRNGTFLKILNSFIPFSCILMYIGHCNSFNRTCTLQSHL